MSALVLTGNDLTISSLVLAARNELGRVTISDESRTKILENRAFAEKVASRGDDVYGLTTGVGMRKKRKVSTSAMVQFNERMIREHATGQGPPIPKDITRAAAILLLNTLAKGFSNVRLEVAERISQRLSQGPPLADVPIFGMTGMGDVTPLAHLVTDLLGTFPPSAGEALPLIAQSSFVAAYAAVAIYDTKGLLKQCVVMAALDVEALACNPSAFHPSLSVVRPYPGYGVVINDMARLLEGSQLLREKPRELQPPLSFRCAATVLGAAYDALAYCETQVTIEINAHQQNPLSNTEEDCMMPCAHFDMQPVATALDFLRLALIPCLTSQTERSIKLLQKSLTGLTDGLEPRGDDGGHGLSEITWPLQSVAVEAKLLALPVSCEVGSSSQAEGIEDRMTMAGLAGRRTLEVVALAHRVLAISGVIAAQAVDLRGKGRLGEQLAEVHRRIREHIPEMKPGDPPPASCEVLVAAIKSGCF